MTKTYKRLYILFSVLVCLLNIAPLLGYVIKAYIECDLIREKVTLTMTVFIVAIMTMITLVNKTIYKSRLWILLLGLYFCLDYILTPLIIVAVCQIIDELIATPLKNHYRTKYQINKEIDKRL